MSALHKGKAVAAHAIKAYTVSGGTAPLIRSGFGGLVVSMLASGTQDHGFKPVCPVSQICGT
jgi:hypothetical protein